MIIPRRSFLIGLGSLIAAPAIVRASSLMPVGGVVMDAYGRSPAMDILAAIRNMQAKMWEDFIVFGQCAYETGPEVPGGIRHVPLDELMALV